MILVIKSNFISCYIKKHSGIKFEHTVSQFDLTVIARSASALVQTLLKVKELLRDYNQCKF